METDLLYIALKNDIIRKIYDGTYRDGEAIPSERTLCDVYKMSRVTVRKALDLLEKDGIIRRKLGQGTIVNLSGQSYNGSLDIIALVAPAQRLFFATFIDYFQKIADQHRSLVVFIQQSEQETIESTLFKLLQNNIHNAVIWLDHETIKSQTLQRLRGLGMNLVLFDITVSSPYADCVYLDNRDAIQTLYWYVKEKNKKSIAYVSRENTNPTSLQERKEAFKELCALSVVWSFPWDYKNYLANRTDSFIFDHLSTMYKPECLICSDGELSIALKKAMIQENINDVLLVSVDDFPECEELGMTVYKQPFDRFAEQIYNCLIEQNFNSASWKAAMYPVKGELVIRE